jgi:hypothetical protein
MEQSDPETHAGLHAGTVNRDNLIFPPSNDYERILFENNNRALDARKQDDGDRFSAPGGGHRSLPQTESEKREAKLNLAIYACCTLVVLGYVLIDAAGKNGPWYFALFPSAVLALFPALFVIAIVRMVRKFFKKP